MRHFALILALGATGCGAAHIRPVSVEPVASPAAWRTAPGPTAPIGSDWWQAFGDPALTRLVARALSHNSDIGIAAGRVREARANLRAARSSLFPSLDAGVAAGRSREVSALGTPDVQTFAAPELQAAYEVDLFGRLADQRAAARNALLASEAGRDSVRLSVTAATASSYVVLLGLDSRLDIARKTLTARSESLRIARSRVDNGYSPALELQQAQAEYDATAAIIPQLELAITRAEDGLALLTGYPPRAVTRGRTLDTLVTPPAAEGLPSELLRRRPDIAQAEYQLAASDRSLAAARKRFLPQLRLSGAAGAALSSLLDNPITIWSLGGSILAPLFEGGQLTAKAEAAAAQRDQAAFGYRRAVLTGFREVEDALAAITRLDEQLVLATHQRDVLAEGVRLATNRYREGYSPYLEQLDAQRQFLAANLTVAQTRADVLIARIQLYQAIGGGWSVESAGAGGER